MGSRDGGRVCVASKSEPVSGRAGEGGGEGVATILTSPNAVSRIYLLRSYLTSLVLGGATAPVGDHHAERSGPAVVLVVLYLEHAVSQQITVRADGHLPVGLPVAIFLRVSRAAVGRDRSKQRHERSGLWRKH